jgi:hypothetical protein
MECFHKSLLKKVGGFHSVAALTIDEMIEISGSDYLGLL